ncbi:MAG: iron permease, partial [Nitrosopumilales archaeon CG11_big_fil_rev_8_21_14_0_20_33_24]
LLNSLELDMRENLRNRIIQKENPTTIIQFVETSILPDLAKAEEMTSKLDSITSIDSPSKQNLKSMGDASEDQKSGVKNKIDVIREQLEETLLHYEQGDVQSAHASARSAYLDSYEFIEIPLRVIDPDFTLEVEYQFAILRNLIKQEAPQNEIHDVIVGIKRNLDESERIVTGTGEIAPAIAFSSSFAIVFREGLESVLILGAILTYLEASRNNQFKKYVYYGIVAAFVATAVTWIIASYIIEISGANRDLIEAIAALSATAVLFYVSFWVLNKIEHKKWMEFVKAKVWQATTTGSVMVFVMLSFFTVYREGFETVLFYQAMSGFAKYMEIYVVLGFVIGMISLLGLYYVMRKLGRKLPLRALFGLTMGVGAYLSIAFLGNAVRELQILDILPYTGLIGIIPRLDINLAMMTGIYPTLETIVAQVILLGVYLIASSYILIIRPQKEQQLTSMRKSRKSSDE